ncbi:hypothetical protein EVAR_32376_1 [Eumeta japonica]|uniref:Uncharacterized protein n=1 Tax=Eumeta variegata TaxID=151549 RepID=A0A4C1VJU4_EUMVA|nr:hypothetical protein EVAR_32376_1 [Eumeta japonica]
MEVIYGSDDSDSDDAECNESRDTAVEEREQQEAAQATGSQSERMAERFRLFRRRDGPICGLRFSLLGDTQFSVSLCVQCSFELCSGVSGYERVRVSVIPRSDHRAPTVKLRAFVLCVHSGLLHRLHAKPAPCFCA